MNREANSVIVVDFGKSKSIRVFSMYLHRFLFSNKILRMLPGYGWNDGGCYTLAKALSVWSKGVLVVRAVEAQRPEREGPTVQHLVVEVPGVARFIDADGIMDAAELLDRKMNYHEGVPNCSIIPIDKARVLSEGEIELLPNVVVRLVEQLELRFGKFKDVFPNVY